MKISSVQIDNYKSFFASPHVLLSPGINVLVGENDTSKTSFVEALSLRFANQPHRSRETFQPPYFSPAPTSTVELKVSFAKKELLDVLRGISPFFLKTFLLGDPTEVLIKSVGAQNEFICRFEGHAQPKETAGVLGGTLNGLLLPVGTNLQPQNYTFNGTKLEKIPPSRGYNASMELEHKLAAFVRDSIYAFEAERYNLGSCNAGNNGILATDSANLAEVLSVLQSHPFKWEQLNRYIHLIFPQVFGVSVLPTANKTVTIQIWNQPPENLPQELAINLSESGTGIGQVLSVLAVILASDHPRTIMIDEPQSFLHPRALRTLVEILSDHPEHQFIIATHSPTVITASRPQNILRTVRNGLTTSVESIDLKQTENLRLLLADIGARLSDVFGAERILWVDGETEETCFPEIMLKLSAHRHYGTKILGVKQTGGFEGRHAKIVLDIYSRLSRGEGLLPPAVGFLFDREGRTDTQRADMERQGKGLMKFLDRRMYENYLLNSSAIADLLNKIPDFRSMPMTLDEITEWIEEHRYSELYIAKASKEPPVEEWLNRVHGAKILAGLVAHFSDGRFIYQKIEHGLILTRWIMENSPTDFSEISTKIDALLSSN